MSCGERIDQLQKRAKSLNTGLEVSMPAEERLAPYKQTDDWPFMKEGFVLRAISGNLTSENFLRVFDEIVFSSSIIQLKNILCDFREAMFSDGSMSELLDIAIGMSKYRHVLEGKIAHVASEIGDQAQIATSLATVLTLKGFNYKVFVDIEEARRWVAG